MMVMKISVRMSELCGRIKEWKTREEEAEANWATEQARMALTKFWKFTGKKFNESRVKNIS